MLQKSKQKLSLLFVAMMAGNASAGGFDLPTVVASHQGTSNANAAEAADPSVIYYNPAGLAKLSPGLKVSQGFTALLLSGKVEVDETATTGTAPFNALNGRPLANDPNLGGDEGTFWPAVLGAGGFFASLPVSDMITVGLGVFAPAGGNLNFKSDWIGAYQIDAVAIETLNINPSMAIRFDDQHSLGFGVSVIGGHLRQKTQVDVQGVSPYLLEAELENGTAINLLGALGAVDQVLAGLCSANPISAVCFPLFQGLGPQLITTDSTASAKIEMYGYGFGWNIGYMFDINDKTRLSLAYRSESTLDMEGEFDWNFSTVTASPLAAPLIGQQGYASMEEYLQQTLRPDTDADAEFIIPARTSASIFHQLTPKIDLMADFTFIETSAVQQISVNLQDKVVNGKNVTQGPGAIDTRWDDSYKFSVGANYHYNDKLVLRSGFQFDKTPVPSAEFRHPGAPDSDRYMYSIGAGYEVKDKLSIDAAYSAVFLADSFSNYRDRCRYGTRENELTGAYDPNGAACTGNGGTFVGRFYDTMIHVLSLQVNQKF